MASSVQIGSDCALEKINVWVVLGKPRNPFPTRVICISTSFPCYHCGRSPADLRLSLRRPAFTPGIFLPWLHAVQNSPWGWGNSDKPLPFSGISFSSSQWGLGPQGSKGPFVLMGVLPVAGPCSPPVAGMQWESPWRSSQVGESSACLPPPPSSRLPSLTGPQGRQLASGASRSRRRECSLEHH